ncbi:MAG: ABC-2 family transporter protein [Caldilineaceae bacterium]
MLKNAFHYLRIYGRLVELHFRSRLEYETDFWVGIIGMGLQNAIGFVFVWALFSRVSTVAGWSLWEIALLYALSILPRGLGELLCDGPWAVRMLVNQGELDRLLVRPASPIFQVTTYWLASMHGLGNVALGVAILVRATVKLHLVWSVGHILLLLVTLINSVVMVSAISLATNAIAFWEPAASGSFPVFVYDFLEFAKFPLNIYHWLLQTFMTWVLPFAFVSYYPGLLLLDKPGVNAWLGYVTPLAGLLTVLIAGLVWRVGLARYQGTGS